MVYIANTIKQTHPTRLLWTSHHPLAEAYTYKKHTHQTDVQPCPQPDSNPSSQKSVGCKPTSWSVGATGPAITLYSYDISEWWKRMEGALLEWCWLKNNDLNTRRKIILSASLLSKEHTRNGPRSNPVLRGVTPATNLHRHSRSILVEHVFVWWGSKRTPTSEITSSLLRNLSSRYFSLKKVEKLGHSVHKTRYFNSAVSVTTQPDRKLQNTGPQIWTTGRQELWPIFSPLQGKTPKEIHSILTERLVRICTVVCHRHKLGGPV